MKWSEMVAGSTEATNAAAADRTQTSQPRRGRTTEAPEREASDLEFLKGMRETRVDVFIGLMMIGSILAAGNTGGSYPHAAAIERIAPSAKTLTSRLELGAAGQRPIIVLAGVPYIAEASPATSGPLTGDNWCSSCSESLAQGGTSARTRMRTTGTLS